MLSLKSNISTKKYIYTYIFATIAGISSRSLWSHAADLHNLNLTSFGHKSHNAWVPWGCEIDQGLRLSVMLRQQHSCPDFKDFGKLGDICRELGYSTEKLLFLSCRQLKGIYFVYLLHVSSTHERSLTHRITTRIVILRLNPSNIDFELYKYWHFARFKFNTLSFDWVARKNNIQLTIF